jgi:hypothetical protein
MSLKLSEVPGRDFLFSIAVNYPDEPDTQQMATQRVFLKQLSEVYPFESLRRTFQSYVSKNEAGLENRRAYTQWMYGLLKALAEKAGIEIPPYTSYLRRVMSYKSNCSKKVYKGRTCRRKAGGGRRRTRSLSLLR